ncbi:MAG: hypothetical protein K9K86_06135, partial [Pseudomonadales bacterium]|nr:hypothetical protein [Pseudomonadales bacterium]
QVYAVEGQCFVLAPCGMVSQEMYDLLVANDEQAALIKVGGGFAQIYAPDGSPICNQIPQTEEGILFAEIDLGAITIAKSFADPVGHYARPDVTRLRLNRNPQPKVETLVPDSFPQTTEKPDNIQDHDIESLENESLDQQ